MRDDGEHLGARAELEDREEIGVVVPEDVAGRRDRVEPGLHALAGVLGGCCRSHGLDVEPVRVVRREVLLNFLDDVGVVRAVLVEPEDDRRVARARAGHRELHLS